MMRMLIILAFAFCFFSYILMDSTERACKILSSEYVNPVEIRQLIFGFMLHFGILLFFLLAAFIKV